MKKIIFTTLCILGCVSLSKAQSNFAVNYIVAIPTGDVEEFVNKTSFRGASLDYSYELDSQFEIGASFSWQNYHKDIGYTTVQEGTQTLTSYRENYISNLNFYATATYFFTSSSKELRPYFSLGVGAMHNTYENYVGFYIINQQEWQFGLQPQIGLRKEINYGIAAQMSVRYNYGFETKDVDAFSAYALGVGIVWMH